MAARGMAIKPAGLQLSDALVRKARLARCRVIEMNGIASWGLEYGSVIENPTSSFPRCRSALIARNCVRASWNFLSLSLSPSPSLSFSFDSFRGYGSCSSHFFISRARVEKKRDSFAT